MPRLSSVQGSPSDLDDIELRIEEAKIISVIIRCPSPGSQLDLASLGLRWARCWRHLPGVPPGPSREEADADDHHRRSPRRLRALS